MSWTDDLTAAYVAGVHDAGNPYFDFLFGDAETATRVLRSWVRRSSSEVALERSHVALADDGATLAAGYVLLPAEELRRCRSADLMALLTARGTVPRDVLRQRLEATRGLFTTAEPGDWYLSKVWVHPSLRSRGLARDVLADILGRAAERGARRVCLDVHEEREAAVRLYRRAGFTIAERRTASGGGLAYLSMHRATDAPTARSDAGQA